MNDLLREYVELVLQERLRGGFDLSKLKRMKSIADVQKYCLDNLDEVGLGSSRAAYVLSSRFALKVAQTKRGIAQNEAEFKASQHPALEGLVVPCSTHHPRFWWIISELVRPIASENEFRKLTGMTLENFVEDIKNERASNLFSARVLRAIKEVGMVPFDVIRIENWGRSASGHPVLLDSGLTQDVKAVAYG